MRSVIFEEIIYISQDVDFNAFKEHVSTCKIEFSWNVRVVCTYQITFCNPFKNHNRGLDGELYLLPANCDQSLNVQE